MTDKGKKKYGYKGKKAARPAVAVFKGALEEIKDHTFVYSQIKTKKWMASREKFIDYAGTEYGANKSASLEQGVGKQSRSGPRLNKTGCFINRAQIHDAFFFY